MSWDDISAQNPDAPPEKMERPEFITINKSEPRVVFLVDGPRQWEDMFFFDCKVLAGEVRKRGGEMDPIEVKKKKPVDLATLKTKSKSLLSNLKYIADNNDGSLMNVEVQIGYNPSTGTPGRFYLSATEIKKDEKYLLKEDRNHPDHLLQRV